MCETQCNEAIMAMLEGRQDKEKPILEIEEAISAIEEFESAAVLKLKRTNKQYYYGNKYDDVMEVGTTKFLILKRKLSTDSVVKIVPPVEFSAPRRQRSNAV